MNKLKIIGVLLLTIPMLIIIMHHNNQFIYLFLYKKGVNKLKSSAFNF